MKPGYQTTEFWVAICVGIIGALFAGDYISQEQQIVWLDAVETIAGAIMAVGASVGYSLSRGNAKKYNGNGDRTKLNKPLTPLEQARLDLLASQKQTEEVKRSLYNERRGSKV